MTWRQFLLLGFLGLVVAGAVAAFEPAPGYMDADYYAAVGARLASGQGFSEPYLWNYLDNPAGLPHPSNAYWMPLASLLVAAGATLFASGSWLAARSGFLLVAACIPPLTTALAFSLTSHRNLAFVSGLLAVFSMFYLPFLPTTDTFGLYLLLGGVFFLTLNRKPFPFKPLALGLLAGLMHLTRADGLLWLLVALLAVVFFEARPSAKTLSARLQSILLCLVGYAVVMGPWMARNLSVFGTALAPGGARSLWLTTYDQLFSYPAGQINFASWWQSGLTAILKARMWALGLNLANTLAMQGEMFVLPLIGIGIWVLRRERVIQVAGLAWCLTLAAMTLAFPFAGARGGFIHSGAAVQMVWWAVAPVGLDQLIVWVTRWRGWKERARTVFQVLLVAGVALVSAVIVAGRLIGAGNGAQPWGRESTAYRKIGAFLETKGAPGDAVVVVANPPGFNLAAGFASIVVPDGDAATVRALARRYGARYLVLEKGSTPNGLLQVYDHPGSFAGLTMLGEVEAARVFLVQP
jgi:hypothetical protein